MSDTFLLATRVPMSRENFERWLAAPVPGRGAISNPEAMFDGWLWDGRRVEGEWDIAAEGGTPREFFADRVERSCTGDPALTVLLYRDGALEAYLGDMGYDQWSMHMAMRIFASAGPFKSDPEEDAVLFWAETGGNLCAPDWPGRLSVLLVGEDHARFTSALDLTGPVTALRPAEDAFFAMIGQTGKEEESWDWNSGSPFRCEAPRAPSFIDPSVLA
ncbi:hypothetical protein [Actinomadura roseirufa]|uniref:hypothetical protein n=1 Tax=Actinomadura roseirufa TaxID=2094049 RepID=UPI001041967B|nr:hypothetical protein [Actinomadura roseirufa]